MPIYLSRSRLETKKIAAVLVKEVLSKPPKIATALVLALSGDLGAGKTTFIQSFIKSCGVKKRITSPTFLIFKRFKIKNLRFKNIYHADVYRIGKIKELLDLGFNRILLDNCNIVLIEWAEKIKRLLPKNVILIKFQHGKKENERFIKINNK